jgi:hypothetical protein
MPEPTDIRPPSEEPTAVLERWAEHGGIWRAKSLEGTEAVVELLTCYGEPVDELRSSDPALLRLLAEQPRSDEP